MKYNVSVIIAHPNTPAGMNSDLLFKLTFEFKHNAESYGNGHYVYINGNNFTEQVIDLRYNTEFNYSKKTEWIKNWANNYWNGKNGAYYLKKITILHAE